MTKDEALKIENSDFNNCTKQELFEYIVVLREALEQQEIGEAEIKQMLNDIEYYQNRVEELEQALKGGVK
jgi:hypothetical protein